MYRLSWNLGASASWNPQGLSRPVMGLLYIHFWSILYCAVNVWSEADFSISLHSVAQNLGFSVPNKLSLLLELLSKDEKWLILWGEVPCDLESLMPSRNGHWLTSMSWIGVVCYFGTPIGLQSYFTWMYSLANYFWKIKYPSEIFHLLWNQ
jgi:hypothetical protein